MIYQVSHMSGNIIGTYHERSGMLPVGVPYMLSRRNMEVGDKVSYDGLTYKRVG